MPNITPSITFHTADSGLTVILKCKKAITQNLTFYVDNTVNPNVDGTYTLLTLEKCNAILKDLVDEVEKQWNDTFNDLVCDIIQAEWTRYYSGEVDRRIDNLDKRILNDQNNTYNNEYPQNTALVDGFLVKLRKILEQKIRDEATTRQNEDTRLERLINELLPPGFMMPVLAGMNGNTPQLPSYIANNFLKCDGSKFTRTQYPKLADVLYPTTVSSLDNTYINSRFKSAWNDIGISSTAPQYWTMSVYDVNRFLGFDIRHYVQCKRDIAYNGMNEANVISWSGSSHSYMLKSFFIDNNGFEFRLWINASDDLDRSPTMSSKTYGTGRWFSNSEMMFYIQVYDYDNRKVLREDIFYCDDYNSNKTTVFSSGNDSIARAKFPSFRQFNRSDFTIHQEISSSYYTTCNTRIIVVPVVLDTSYRVESFRNRKILGKVRNILTLNHGLAGDQKCTATNTLTDQACSVELLGRWEADMETASTMLTVTPDELRAFFMTRAPNMKTIQLYNTNKFRPYVEGGTTYGSMKFKNADSWFPVDYARQITNIWNDRFMYVRATDTKFNVKWERVFYSERNSLTFSNGSEIDNYKKVVGTGLSKHDAANDNIDYGDLYLMEHREDMIVQIYWFATADVVIDVTRKLKREVIRRTQSYSEGRYSSTQTLQAAYYGARYAYSTNSNSTYSHNGYNLNYGMPKYFFLPWREGISYMLRKGDSIGSGTVSTSDYFKYGQAYIDMDPDTITGSYTGTSFTTITSATSSSPYTYARVRLGLYSGSTWSLQGRFYNGNWTSWTNQYNFNMTKGDLVLIRFQCESSNSGTYHDFLPPIWLFVNDYANSTSATSSYNDISLFSNSFNGEYYTSSGSVDQEILTNYDNISQQTGYDMKRVRIIARKVSSSFYPASIDYAYEKFTEDTDLYLPDMTEEGTFIGGGPDVGRFKGWTIPNIAGDAGEFNDRAQVTSGVLTSTGRTGGAGAGVSGGGRGTYIKLDLLYSKSYQAHVNNMDKFYTSHYPCVYFIKFK